MDQSWRPGVVITAGPVTLEVGGPAMSGLPPNPALKQLEVLIGEWEVEVPQFPGHGGRATFEWLEDGAFLRYHAEAPDPAPSATLIISRDESSEVYTVLHYDSRGVSRVYQMSFDGSAWHAGPRPDRRWDGPKRGSVT